MFKCKNCHASEYETLYLAQPDRFYGNSGRFPYVVCSQCKLAQIETEPEDLGSYYSGYRLHAKETVLYSLIRKMTVGKCYYLPKGKPGRVLDVGCGGGWYLREMQQRGWEAHGCELDPEYASSLSKDTGLPVYSADELLDSPDASYDLVTFHFSFEHLTEPEKFARLAHDLLKPGGKLHIAVPNIAGREARLFKGRWFHLDPPRHIVLYTKKQLGELLRTIGFGDTRTRNLPVPTGFAGSLSYLLANSFSVPIWYAGMAPGMLFCQLVRDGNFMIQATKSA